MTRINLIPVGELVREHLIAEYKELPRVFNLVRMAIERGETPATVKAPPNYTMGKGHVKFFFTRLAWVTERFELLVDEMLRRGYKPSYFSAPADGIPNEWFGSWQPTETDLAISLARIEERKKSWTSNS